MIKKNLLILYCSKRYNLCLKLISFHILLLIAKNLNYNCVFIYFLLNLIASSVKKIYKCIIKSLLKKANKNDYGTLCSSEIFFNATKTFFFNNQ